VHPADVQNRDGAFHLLRRARRMFPLGAHPGARALDGDFRDRDNFAPDIRRCPPGKIDVDRID
jgi:hypothetical protein